jgi:hypothetical protein
VVAEYVSSFGFTTDHVRQQTLNVFVGMGPINPGVAKSALGRFQIDSSIGWRVRIHDPSLPVTFESGRFSQKASMDLRESTEIIFKSHT